MKRRLSIWLALCLFCHTDSEGRGNHGGVRKGARDEYHGADCRVDGNLRLHAG